MHIPTRARLTQCVFVLAFALCSAAAIAAPSPEQQAIGHDIDAEIAAGRLTGVSVALVQHGAIVWEDGFGFADRETKRKATSHTPFSIASTTKPFTTTAMMTLVAAGKLQLDKPANDYLGADKIEDDNGPVATATVRRLASHTSGLSTFFTMYPHGVGKPTVPELLRDYGHVFAPPGERYEYSNLALTTLAYIVERQSGQDFADYLDAHVFKPLQMNDSFYGTDLRRTAAGAVRYEIDGTPLPPYLTGTPGSGEVYASAHDMALFAMMHLKDKLPAGGQILTAAQIDELHRPQVVVNAPQFSYGMGWQIWHPPGQEPVIYHGGGQVGVLAEFVLVPSADAAVVVLSNRKTDRAFLEQVRDRLLKTAVPSWKGLPSAPAPVPKALAPAGDYAGTWRGYMLVQRKRMPVVLTIAADAASGTVSVNGAPAQALKDLALNDGLVTSTAQIAIDAPDEKRFGVSEMEIDLKLRGERMDGEVEDYKITSSHMTILPHRIVLERSH